VVHIRCAVIPHFRHGDIFQEIVIVNPLNQGQLRVHGELFIYLPLPEPPEEGGLKTMPLLLNAVLLILSAVTGFCPLYAVLLVNTADHSKR
jgi:hypothetical protein